MRYGVLVGWCLAAACVVAGPAEARLLSRAPASLARVAQVGATALGGHLRPGLVPSPARLARARGGGASALSRPSRGERRRVIFVVLRLCGADSACLAMLRIFRLLSGIRGACGGNCLEDDRDRRGGTSALGHHFCYFYETTDDLLDTLAPYFLAGLESGEFCVWVIADPLTEADARRALGHTVPASGDIEILPAREWYLEDTAVDPKTVMDGWNDKLVAALGRGSQPMTLLCAYPVRAPGVAEILDVARTHHFSLARRQGQWEVFEPSELDRPNEEIRRRDEEQLRKSEERWRAVFENSAVGIVLQSADRSGRFLAANAAYQRMLGYSPEELRTLTFMDITYEEDREANRRLADELLEGKRQSFDLTKRNRRKDGTLMWVSIHVSLIPGTGSNDQLFMSIVDDITERKRAEEALGRSERQFRALFEEAADENVDSIGADGVGQGSRLRALMFIGWTFILIPPQGGHQHDRNERLCRARGQREASRHDDARPLRRLEAPRPRDQ